MQDCAGRDEAQKKKTEAEQARREKLHCSSLNENIRWSAAKQLCYECPRMLEDAAIYIGRQVDR